MLSVHLSRPLQAVVLAMKLADRDLKAKINAATRDTMNPVWRAQVERHASSRLDAAVLGKGARIAAGNPPAAVAASSRRALSGGLVPADNWQRWEFGVVSSEAYTTYQVGGHTRRQAGRVVQVAAHQVRRRTARQMPPRVAAGRVLYPAFAEIAPRVAALWAQIVVKEYAEALESAGKE